jgi:hypothetical protein
MFAAGYLGMLKRLSNAVSLLYVNQSSSLKIASPASPGRLARLLINPC